MGMSYSITITALNQRALEALTDSKQGRLEMKVRRRDGAIAQSFCLEVAQAIMRIRNERIAGEIE